MYKFVFNMCYIKFIKQLWINNRYITSIMKWYNILNVLNIMKFLWIILQIQCNLKIIMLDL